MIWHVYIYYNINITKTSLYVSDYAATKTVTEKYNMMLQVKIELNKIEL